MGTLRRKPKVLVADDSPIVSTLVSEIVREAGAEVIGPAEDGTRALELFAAHAPEVAVLDISMPGVSGLEVLRQIRARPQGGRCVVILLTSHAEQAFRERAMTDGADHYLHKTADLERLSPTLRQTFDDLSAA